MGKRKGKEKGGGSKVGFYGKSLVDMIHTPILHLIKNNCMKLVGIVSQWHR